MVRDGLVESYWKQSERGGPRCKYYSLTEIGARKLEAFLELWREFDGEFNRLLTLSCGTPEVGNELDFTKSTGVSDRESEMPVLSEA